MKKAIIVVATMMVATVAMVGISPLAAADDRIKRHCAAAMDFLRPGGIRMLERDLGLRSTGKCGENLWYVARDTVVGYETARGGGILRTYPRNPVMEVACRSNRFYDSRYCETSMRLIFDTPPVQDAPAEATTTVEPAPADASPVQEAPATTTGPTQEESAWVDLRKAFDLTDQRMRELEALRKAKAKAK